MGQDIDPPPTVSYELPYRIASIREATLAFSPHVPAHLGSPTRLTWRGTAIPAVFRSIAWAYDHLTHGRLFVREAIIDGTSARGAWDDDVRQTPGCRNFFGGSTGVYGVRSFVTIRGGTRGFLEEMAGSTFLRWLEPLQGLDQVALAPYLANVPDPMLEILIAGPAPDFTAADAEVVAGLV